MERISVKAESREVGKKGLNNRLRKAGQVPGVLYGHGTDPQGLSLNSKDLTSKLKAVGTNVLINLEVPSKGGSSNDSLVVMLKDFQTNSITRKLTHVDLYKVDMNEKLAIKIPIKVTGKALGLSKGGLVELIRREIEIRCLPAKIPDAIEIDITELDLGHSIHIHEIKLPEGVEIPHGATYAIVSVVAPREEKVEAAPTADAAATPAAAAPTAEAAPAKAEKK